MINKTAASYPIDIFVAGDLAAARRICAEYCLEVGLCVHIIPTEFVYTGGVESGVKVGLVNYPRFPVEPQALFSTAEQLAERLIVGLFQHSALVQAPNKALWLTRRPENK